MVGLVGNCRENPSNWLVGAKFGGGKKPKVDQMSKSKKQNETPASKVLCGVDSGSITMINIVIFDF